LIKLIVTDVDGTLVEDGSSNLNPEYKVVIKKLLEQGICFVVASGRQYTSIKKLFGEIADHLWYITEGGTVIIRKDEILHVDALPDHYVKELVEDVHRLEDCDALICGQLKAYVPCEGSKMHLWMKNDYGYDIEPLGGWDQLPEEKVVKVSVYHPSDAEGVTKEWFVPKWSPHVKISCAGHWWMDCIKPGVDKGSAVRRIQEIIGVTPEETMVFGDNLNDVEMLQSAKYSYAVANAREEAKQAANYIADSYQKNGVLQEIKKLLQHE
jgi:Cof subfamily protein (haloacid dehalogenase superfamily)